MYYAVIAFDQPDSLARRRSVRDAHLARLQALQDAGRLLLAGPHPAIDAEDPGDAGFTGSLIVAQFPSLEEARSWADDDPYRKAGVYREVLVKPLRRVFPDTAAPHNPSEQQGEQQDEQQGEQQGEQQVTSMQTPAAQPAAQPAAHEPHDDTAQRIRRSLQTALQPSRLIIADESAQHDGHRGNTSGGGHFAVQIVAPCFQGKSALERHRMVYQALAALMPGTIHALRIDARSPDARSPDECSGKT